MQCSSSFAFPEFEWVRKGSRMTQWGAALQNLSWCCTKAQFLQTLKCVQDLEKSCVSSVLQGTRNIFSPLLLSPAAAEQEMSRALDLSSHLPLCLAHPRSAPQIFSSQELLLLPSLLSPPWKQSSLQYFLCQVLEDTQEGNLLSENKHSKFWFYLSLIPPQ